MDPIRDKYIFDLGKELKEGVSLYVEPGSDYNVIFFKIFLALSFVVLKV